MSKRSQSPGDERQKPSMSKSASPSPSSQSQPQTQTQTQPQPGIYSQPSSSDFTHTEGEGEGEGVAEQEVLVDYSKDQLHEYHPDVRRPKLKLLAPEVSELLYHMDDKFYKLFHRITLLENLINEIDVKLNGNVENIERSAGEIIKVISYIRGVGEGADV